MAIHRSKTQPTFRILFFGVLATIGFAEEVENRPLMGTWVDFGLNRMEHDPGTPDETVNQLTLDAELRVTGLESNSS
jgi:hypothetical protein